LANTAQARKRALQAENHRQRNASQKSKMRTEMKKTIEAVSSGDKENAMSSLGMTSSLLDRAVKNGLIHKNKAARHKQRINARIKAI